MDIKKMKNDIKSYNQKYGTKQTDTTAMKLRLRIMKKNHSDNEWLQLREEVRNYIKTNPGDSELAILRDSCDMLNMVCSGIEWKKEH